MRSVAKQMSRPTPSKCAILGVSSKGASPFMFICPLDTNFSKTLENPKDFDPVLSNDPTKEFDVEDPNNQPAFVVFKSGKRIPLEDDDPEPDLLGEASRYSHYSQRARCYRDSIVFVTLSRYTAEKYCITHRDCFFIRCVNMTDALLFNV